MSAQDHDKSQRAAMIGASNGQELDPGYYVLSQISSGGNSVTVGELLIESNLTEHWGLYVDVYARPTPGQTKSITFAGQSSTISLSVFLGHLTTRVNNNLDTEYWIHSVSQGTIPR